MKKSLDELRAEIDSIDNQLIQVLNKRMDLVRAIGDLKRTSKSTIYRPEREQAIVDRLTKASSGILSKKAIEAIFLEIFAVSRNLELPERIGYLGPEGSFTHQAAESRFGAMSEYLPLQSIKAVFDAVQTERIKFGVVPIENNQQGIVNETIDYLGQYDLVIAAEISLPIHFAFASLNDHIPSIARIYSKDIAFAQCQKFIHDTLDEEQIKLIPVESTSRAVHLAMEDPDSAAICSHIAARQRQLPILFENIEDSSTNYTRFLILASIFVNEISGNDKTTILAKVPHKPGSLVTFLKDFEEHGINLSKIESRPAKKGKSFNYLFFIDFDGHINEDRVQAVYKKHKTHIKWLGSYLKMV